MSRGSAGNVIAALASFFIPGLGQLVQGRIWPALGMVLLAGILWVLTLGHFGWIAHLIAAFEAAVWKPRQ